MSASDFDITGYVLERLVYFNVGKLEESPPVVQMECMTCDEDDFIFYTGDGRDLADSGWITKAVVHGHKYHPVRMTTGEGFS